MDVNGTRFHLLLGEQDWLGAGEPPRGVAWSAQHGAIELENLPFVFPQRHGEMPPEPAARRGAGRDRFGNWYWIEGEGRVLLARAPRDSAPRPFWPGAGARARAAEGEFEPAEPPAAGTPPRLRGLAVTSEHYLIAGTLEPAGLLVFDLAAGGPPVALEWPADVPFAPWDIAAAPDGGAWILDLDNARLWSIDRQFRVRAEELPASAAAAEPEFTPVSPSPAPPAALTAPAGPARAVTMAASIDVSAVPALAAVEALPDGSALLLGRDATANAPALYRYTLDGAAGTYRIAALLAPHAQVRERLPRAHDLAFVGTMQSEGAIDGTLFLAAPEGNQAFAFRLSGRAPALAVDFLHEFYPMRRFGGRGVVAAGGEAHYDSEQRWVALLEQPRPRYVAEGAIELPLGGVATRAFDGREPGCVWHRLFLDACIPPGTKVTVYSVAADTVRELESETWHEEPRPYRRSAGTELPWQASAAGDADGAGTWELLFQRARGRYLQLRVVLQGNGRATPRLHALRVYYPRFSYLREYLPAVWREDVASASFVDRYLGNVEGTLTEIEGRIAAAQVLFDTRTAPAEFLDWLAGWLGATLDAAWDERKRRFFLANAMRMFAGRGTRAGLVRALRLALEECPDPDLFAERPGAAPAFGVRIVERFLARSAPGVAFDDVGGGTPAAAGARWSPAQGAGPLHARWRAWLADHYPNVKALNDAWGTSFDSLDDLAIRLRATAPAAAAAADWRRFLRSGLDFTYAVPDAADRALWQDFLARRYPQIADLNRAWRRYGNARLASFAAAVLPADMPSGGAELADWIAFVSVVLPMQRGAHRFTVLVPVRLDDPPGVQRARRALADRVAALEKPAHTVVESRLYWAAFQVGSARVGADSVLGPGSRFAALLLGRGELAGSYLGWTEPWNVAARRVVGRDPAAIRLQPQGMPARCS